MYTLRERAQIALKRMRSHLRREWRLQDYPVRVRRNGNGAPAESPYFAQILNWSGPTGLGATPEEAISSLKEHLESIRQYRREHNQAMPRPGAEVPIQFASTSRVESDPALLDDFIEHVLGFTLGDPLFVSDESSLADFGDEDHERALRDKIQQRYKVDVSDLTQGLICEILERLKASKPRP